MQHSEQIDQIATALAKAQLEMPHAIFDAKNAFFKRSDGTAAPYASLKSVIDAWKASAPKNGLSYSQFPHHDEDGCPVLTTIIMHNSGQWIKSTYRTNPKDNTPQAVGSAITYARRYSLAALAGIASDDDDEGNAAQGNGDKKSIAPMDKTGSRAVDKWVNNAVADLSACTNLDDLKGLFGDFWKDAKKKGCTQDQIDMIQQQYEATKERLTIKDVERRGAIDPNDDIPDFAGE